MVKRTLLRAFHLIKVVKRLLAYSGIAHAGYLMMGLLSFNREGNAAVVYYIAVHAR